MTRPSKRTIISRQAKAIHKRRRLAEAEAESQKIAEPMFPYRGGDEGDKNDNPVEKEGDKNGVPVEKGREGEDEGGGEAENNSLEGYIGSFQVPVHDDADSEPAPLPEQIAQTGVYEPGSGLQTKPPSWPRISGLKRIEILKAGTAYCLRI
jgi:hypothetical protein